MCNRSNYSLYFSIEYYHRWLCHPNPCMGALLLLGRHVQCWWSVGGRCGSAAGRTHDGPHIVSRRVVEYFWRAEGRLDIQKTGYQFLSSDATYHSRRVKFERPRKGLNIGHLSWRILPTYPNATNSTCRGYDRVGERSRNGLTHESEEGRKEGRNSRFLEFKLHVFLHVERSGIVCPAMVSRRKEGSARPGGRNKSRGSHKKRADEKQENRWIQDAEEGNKGWRDLHTYQYSDVGIQYTERDRIGERRNERAVRKEFEFWYDPLGLLTGL